MRFNWSCPHCHRPQVATDANFYESEIPLQIGKLDIGPVSVRLKSFACLNPDCAKLTLAAGLHRRVNTGGYWLLEDNPIASWRLVPESTAIPQPDYIPKALTESYSEGCKIRDLSPKASATMARRCLQGMIRDFCQIVKSTLDAEIKELRARLDEGKAPAGVTSESIDAIDQVRSVGNIGAHMEGDINLVIDVDPGEAQALIELVELLFEEWYVARHNRQQRFGHIAAIAAEKKAQIAEAKAQQAHAKAGDGQHQLKK